MFFGAGNKVISKDENNYPVIAINTERGATSVEKVLKIMNDTNMTTHIMQPYYKWDWTKTDAVFGDNRGYSIPSFSALLCVYAKLTNFGILPMPKYDEAQDKYYTCFHSLYFKGSRYMVTSTDVSSIGMILEYMGYIHGT